MQATATIQTLGVPDDGTLLTVGPPAASVIFEFAGRDPESGNVWINTKQKETDHVQPEYTPTDIADLIRQALNSYADDTNCDVTFDDIDLLTLTVRDDGEVGNSYINTTDSAALVVTEFSGGV